MSFVEFIKELYPPHKARLIRNSTFGDEVASTILKNQDLPALKELFESIPNNWIDRYFYSVAMSRSFPFEMLGAWVDAEPDSADAHLVYGAQLVNWARSARGYGRGHDVTEKQWKMFFKRLEFTHEILRKSAALRPDDPTPWVFLIMVAVYLEVGEEVEYSFFQEAVSRDPNSWTAHMNRLTGLSEKYGGSHARMFEFAYSVAENAEEGSLLPAIVIKAHSEKWKYLDLFEGDHAAAEKYANEKYVQEEAIEAYESTLGSNEYHEREAIFARINASGWFWITRDKGRLRKELLALKDRIEPPHWRWVGTEPYLAQAKKLAGI